MFQKPYDELVFSDDFLFCMIMQDEGLCIEVVEVLLGIKIKNILIHNKQHVIDPSYDGHGVRLDVYLEGDGTVIDLEMQSVSESNLGLRSRFYQSMIDFEHLSRGIHYSKLLQSYIVFICKNNPFPQIKNLPELPVYNFTNCISDRPEYKLNDKTLKAFYNASAWNNTENIKLKALLKYITDGSVCSELTEKLEQAVVFAKKKEEWREKYMTWSLAYEDAKFYAHEDGLAEGRAESKLHDAVLAVQKLNVAPEKAAEVFGISLETLEQELNGEAVK